MSLKFAMYIIVSMCSKYEPSVRVDCIQYMKTCTFNADLIGTPDLNGQIRTLETMLETCRENWYEQR